MPEQQYGFRKYLETVHQPYCRDRALSPAKNELEITSAWQIRIPPDASGFLQDTADDLADFLAVSMDCRVPVVRGGETGVHHIVLDLAEKGSLNRKRAFRFSAENDGPVRIEGADERGIALGCFYLEDRMRLREAPFLPCLRKVVEPRFAPRIVHSAWGMDLFTPAYLRRIAHEGYDTILVFVLGKDLGHQGKTDFNALIAEAAKAGLDVFFYSHIKNTFHPEDPGAKEFYEENYGGLFRDHPGAKGLILVGESCQFPSRDPNVADLKDPGREEQCFHSGKPNPGWWPCEDFPLFVRMIRDSVRKYSPEADIVFWTYNWAYAPAELRTKLIRNLPGDVTVELNFELHDNVPVWNTRERALDYTISLPGPSRLFREEGAAARERALPLCAMSNTGGRTWDIGCVPFIPAPFQWMRRMENLLEAQKEFGLSGLMESHHYGLFPSLVSDLGKWMLLYGSEEPPREILRKLAVRDFSEACADRVLAVWKDWSDAVASFITPIEDQYGPCRVGPSSTFYFGPVSLRLNFGATARFPWTEKNFYEIAYPSYAPVNDPDGLDMGARRTEAEIAHLPGVIERWEGGADALEQLLPEVPDRKHPQIRRMIGVARYIARTLTTTLHIKLWWRENTRLALETDPARADRILDGIVEIVRREQQNVRAAIPLAEADSALGYEPSMDYVSDPAHLEWKLRQLDSVLEQDIRKYRTAIQLASKLKAASSSGS